MHKEKNNFVQKFRIDLQNLGVRQGGVLLVHSSLKSLGRVPGGPETVVQGLLAAVGEHGTLLMPALTYESVRSDRPIFDVRSTPSCVGIISEHFRTRPGTLRSIHPTHSVSGVGPWATEILSPHIQDSTPCGPNSPFHRLRNYTGQILMLGCGLRPNTAIHAIEELSKPPYLFGSPLIYTLINELGETTQKEYLRHGFVNWQQRYDRIADILQEPALKSGSVRTANAFLIEAAELWEAVKSKLEQNPVYFVDRI